jgi:hypothetical protein
VITQSLAIQVDVAPADVFGWLTDAANHPRWDSSSLRMDPDETPWRTGTTFTELRRIGPRKVEIRSRCASLKEGSAFEIESLTGPEFHGHWRIRPQSRGTLIEWSGQMRLGGARRVFEPLVQRGFRRSTARNFARLKSVIEADFAGTSARD